MPDPAIVFPESDALQGYFRRLAKPEHGSLDAAPGTYRVVNVDVDAALAALVIAEADRLRVDYGTAVRAVLRCALGHSLDPSRRPQQGALDLGRVAS